MLNSLNSGVAGIRNFQAKLDVIGNNIANSNTIAYKNARANFADAFSQTLAGGSTVGGTLQVGSGVTTSSIKTDFTRGSYQKTGRPDDLSIQNGDGFFIVKDSDGREFATRAGDFIVDKAGYLTTNEGYRVQGFSNQVAPGGTFTTRGDIRIFDDPANRPITADPAATAVGYKYTGEGRVRLRLSDGNEYDAGQILLQKFTDTSLLEKEGNNLYSNLRQAGPLGGDALISEAPGTNGMGVIEAASLEMSNVDLASEFAELITTQRSFQANARIITTSDEILQEVVNLKH
jgi:flagellar hook protein FlgE